MISNRSHQKAAEYTMALPISAVSGAERFFASIEISFRHALATLLAPVALLTLAAVPVFAQSEMTADEDLPTPAAVGDEISPEEDSDALALTIDEAIQIALVNNYAIRHGRLDVRTAQAQVREAWGEVMPLIEAQSSYTRNLKSANPFAGSEAGGLFASFGYVDWLSYNEEARTDEDPSTVPISYDEFQDRRQSGLDAIGAGLGGSDNPFAVPNEFQSGISISQTLYNGSAFAAIKGAEKLKDINRRGLDRQEQLIVDEVRRAYYQALLAEEQEAVVRQSVRRTAQTLTDVTRQVTQGTAPKFQRLTAEVELANLQTQFVQTQNVSEQALDNLKMQLGIPVDQPVSLRGLLEADDPARYVDVAVEDAVELALQRRPDLEQARLAIDLRRVDKNITKARFLPTVSAFANFNYSGRVPDDRTNILANPDDPFSFSRRTNDFFSQSYWNPSINAGVRLTWTIFNGFQTSAQVQQRQILVEKAETDLEQTMQTVRLEVQNALRNLDASRRRILSQEQNVQKAELNYEYAHARLREGVATPLEERNASEQLDESRVNYLQAVHDYLVARSAFETAVGVPPGEASSLRLTRN